MQATVIPYRYGRASLEAQGLICGQAGDPNPIQTTRTQALPLAKMLIGDALLIVKSQTLVAKIQLAKATVKRYNVKYRNPMFGIVETSETLEIVRIR